MEIKNEFDKEKAKKIANNKSFVDAGKRGVVYKSGRYLLKYKKLDSTAQNTIQNEAYFNHVLNKHGLAPKLYYLDPSGEFFIRDFVEGKQFRKYIENLDEIEAVEIKSVLRDLLLKARKFDVLGINKTEWTNPYKDVIVQRGKPVLIDFERCRWSETPQNVNQLLQFLMRNDLKPVLKKAGIKAGMKEIVLLGRKYKEKYEEKRFEDIMNFFSFS